MTDPTAAAPSEPTEQGAIYRAARLRIDELVRGAGPAGWATAVPATPGWTVHELVSHLAGITDDALHGNMAGAPGPEWTAAQVAKRTGASTVAVLDAWAADAPAFEALPLPFPPMADIVSHEQDLRGALGRPGARDSAELAYLLPTLLDAAAQRLAARHECVVDVRAGSASTSAGEGEGMLTLTTTPFELLRALFGRRSAAQLHALDWGGSFVPDVEALCVFGPRDTDLVE
jgi:uncharacterized protein (TIGR03083 family)